MKTLANQATSVFAVASAMLLSTSPVIANGGPPNYLPQSAPFGTTLSEWTADWWQSVLSLPLNVNPLADETGSSCMLGQRGAVWFLAGNFGGTAAPSTRSCSIPENVMLFFPVLNVVDINTTTQTANELRAETAPCLDAATELVVEVDHQPIAGLYDKFRVRSTVFEVTMPDDNLFGIPAGTYSPAIDDGFYVMLKPLAVGDHLIHIVGASAGCALLPFEFSTDVTYHVTIVPVTLH
ncbi:MAG: hypothetical protein ACM3QY_02305 [Candidatus Levyibacteriota bacterium]